MINSMELKNKGRQDNLKEGALKMIKRISVTDARRGLGRLMDEVILKGVDYIVERNGKPVAVIIPVERYLSLEKTGSEGNGRLSSY